MSKKTLTEYEKLIYDDFMRGLTPGGVSIKRKLPMAEVNEARYQILKKGYSLPDGNGGAVLPVREVKPEAEPQQKKDPRGRRWTPEQKEEILRYSDSHTDRETVARYGLSRYTLWKWKAAQKPQEDAQEPPTVQAVTSTPSVPEGVLEAVRAQVEACNSEVARLREMLEEKERQAAELRKWLREVSA